MPLSLLPALNACLNVTAALLLLLGWKAIRAKKIGAHKNLMSAAFAASFLFLIFYLIYHLKTGTTHYQGEGLVRILYFVILLTHTPLAVLVVPFSLAAFYYAWKKDYPAHVRITRWLLPVWLYVSVTGVLIYGMLYGWPFSFF